MRRILNTARLALGLIAVVAAVAFGWSYGSALGTAAGEAIAYPAQSHDVPVCTLTDEEEI